MVKKGWVPKTRILEEKTINLFEYFGISNHNSWVKLYIESELKVAAYTTLKHTNDPHAISAWLRKGELKAQEIDAPDYNEKLFKANLKKIKGLMAKHPADYFSRLKELCHEAGVKVFYTPKLPKAPISGSTRWINDSPIIQLTARYKQNDRFWVTFFHEAGHIILHGKKYISLEEINFAGADPKKEKEAHEFAEEWTLNKKQEKIITESAPLTTEAIVHFAEKFNTHPAIIIGRLQHLKLIPFSEGKEFIQAIDLSE